MNQLDQVTQTNAATSEETASAAEELSSQAESLRSVIGILVAAIKGSDGEVKTQEHSFSTNDNSSTPGKSKVKNNVTALRKEKPASNVKKFKQASGFGGTSVPAEDDSRFQDV